MKKIWNKILYGFMSLVMVIGCGVLVTACGKDDTTKVMNVSLNPEIEFILDKNDKVVTVSASNNEGNFIVANADFSGLSAEDAIELFLTKAKESGYIIDGVGVLGDDEISIEISGENAEDLFDDVKKSAKEYLSSINVDITIDFDEIEKEDIEELVADCMKEYSDSDLADLSEEELIELLKTSREETENFFSEELKEFYYNCRFEEILKQKFEAIKTQLDAMTSSIPGVDLSAMKNNMSSKLTEFATKIEDYKNAYINNYLSESSDYQEAMQNYIDAKKEVLEARLNGESVTALMTALNNAEVQMSIKENAAELAMASYQTAIQTIKSSLDLIVNSINTIFNQENINNAIITAKTEFQAQFTSDFNSYINEKHWDKLNPQESQS